MADVFDAPVAETVVTPEAVTPPTKETTPSEVESTESEVKPERTFTQKELDDILQKRLAKEHRKIEKFARADAENQYLREQLSRQQTQQQSIPSGEPKPEQFKDYESYIEALTDYKVEKKLAVVQERSAQQRQAEAQQSAEQKIRENLSKAAEKYDDFEEVVTNPSLTITAAMRDSIGESELGGEIAYYLGSNPKEAAEIAQLSPVQQVKAIDRLEQKLKAPKKVTTDAPAPIVPNAGKGKVAKDPGQMTDAEYAKWRRSGK